MSVKRSVASPNKWIMHEEITHKRPPTWAEVTNDYHLYEFRQMSLLFIHKSALLGWAGVDQFSSRRSLSCGTFLLIFFLTHNEAQVTARNMWPAAIR